MKSILIFIIFMAITVLFQGLKQEGSKNNKQAAPKPNRPNVPPTVAPHRSPANQNAGSMQSKVQPSKSPEQNIPVIIEEVFDPEGIQTEGPTRGAVVQKKMESEPVIEPAHFEIETEDLQRSIIMTEILGKPKALRKS